jgi:hypothetical protein
MKRQDVQPSVTSVVAAPDAAPTSVIASVSPDASITSAVQSDGAPTSIIASAAAPDASALSASVGGSSPSALPLPTDVLPEPVTPSIAVSAPSALPPSNGGTNATDALPPLPSVVGTPDPSAAPPTGPPPPVAPPAAPPAPASPIKALEIQIPINTAILNAIVGTSVTPPQPAQNQLALGTTDTLDLMLRNIPFQIGRRDVGSKGPFVPLPLTGGQAQGVQLSVDGGKLMITGYNQLDGEYVVLVPSNGAAASAAVNKSENAGIRTSVGKGVVIGAVLGMVGWMAMLL